MCSLELENASWMLLSICSLFDDGDVRLVRMLMFLLIMLLAVTMNFIKFVQQQNKIRSQKQTNVITESCCIFPLEIIMSERHFNCMSFHLSFSRRSPNILDVLHYTHAKLL